MNRLTKRGSTDIKKTYFANDLHRLCDMRSDYCQKKVCDRRADRSCPYLQCMDRLAAYEDTGMEPEEIRTVQECLAPIPFGRFHDIMEAERDGRLVLLPCKIDTPIYLLRSKKEPRKPTKYWVEEYDIDHFTIGGTMIPMITACNKENEWEELIDGTLEGAEFFLSREAAEKAIAKEAEK